MVGDTIQAPTYLCAGFPISDEPQKTSEKVMFVKRRLAKAGVNRRRLIFIRPAETESSSRPNNRSGPYNTTNNQTSPAPAPADTY